MDFLKAIGAGLGGIVIVAFMVIVGRWFFGWLESTDLMLEIGVWSLVGLLLLVYIRLDKLVDEFTGIGPLHWAIMDIKGDELREAITDIKADVADIRWKLREEDEDLDSTL